MHAKLPVGGVVFAASLLALSVLSAPGQEGKASAQPKPAPEGLVGYWKLDEGAGQIAFDYSGRQAHAEIIGGASWETGDQGQELRLDGKTGRVSIPDGPWNIGSPVTYLCRYRAEKTGNIFEHELGGAIPGAFALFAGGRFACYDGKTTDVGGASVPQILGAWVSVAVTITPTEIRCYQNGEQTSSTPIQNMPKHRGPLTLGARGCVPDGFLAGSIREMAVFNRALSAEEIAVIHRDFQKGVPLYQPAAGLKLLAVRPERIYYRPDDSGKVELIVKNFSTSEQTASLAITCLTRLATSQEVSRQEITLKPLEGRLMSVPVSFKGQEFGCVIEASLSHGKDVFDRAQGLVGVADNLWAVGVGGQLDPGEIGAASPARLDAIVKDARNRYANWLEMFFWAPDDWGNLNPTVDDWYSGQANYYETRTQIRGFIERARAQGIGMITYGKSTACGPDGWELARRHPEWFYTDRRHHVSGAYDVRQLDEWNDKAARQRKGAQFGWKWLYPDLRREDALDFGIAQIADSAKAYGWDGVRFDGHFTVASDALSTWNMRRLKEKVWAGRPGFAFGFNYAFAPSNYPVITHEMKEGMAGGGMWMQEAIRDFTYAGGGGRYEHWTQSSPARPAYAPNELAVAKQILAMGGHYHCILGLDATPRSVYKLIFSLIAGSHSVYGSHEKTPGCENWGKFMTRWSAFLWHPRLKPVTQPTTRLSVSAPAPLLQNGSSEETKSAPRASGLYWQPLVQELADTPTRRFTVVHLVNPPSDDVIEKTSLPPPASNVTVRIKPEAGAQIQRVGIVQPDSPMMDQALLVQPKKTTDGLEVLVPEIGTWAMVIIEEAGKFTIPPLPPRFSEPPNPSEVTAARSQAVAALTNDPLQPPAAGLKLEDSEQMYETDTSYNSVPAQEVADPDAMNGRAQVREDHVKSVHYGRSWLGPFVPGRYQTRMRVKLTDERQPPRRQSSGMTTYILHGNQQKTVNTGFDSDEKTPAERRLIVDGKYHDYVISEVDLRETAILHLLGNTRAEDADGNRFHCDHVIVKQLERYTDAQLAEGNPSSKPDGLRPPQGRAPQKILQVRGLYWQFYGAEKQLSGCTGAYALPAEYEDLYTYDAVVLTNFDMLGSSFQTRRMLRDFVEDGGRLVILGGPSALGQGGLHKTCLENTLPFLLGPETDAEVVSSPVPILLGPKASQPWSDKPALFWRHQVKVRPEAETLAWAGDAAIAARLAVGKGMVCVFAGTVLGDPSAGTTPFWSCASWTELLTALVVK